MLWGAHYYNSTAPSGQTHPVMMHASLLTILALVALSTATVSNIPSTPAIDTFDGDMQLQVGANKTISFQFGPNDGDKVDVKDAHEPTISALALGYR